MENTNMTNKNTVNLIEMDKLNNNQSANVNQELLNLSI
jgi:hypothetical protein